ncbi:MAG: hypothetical protein KAS12_02670 [Candidatus Aenigmarchaeota archaeon]|nr:hypothetical protein [Candidatus Aenigmarchaeota archaeon]
MSIFKKYTHQLKIGLSFGLTSGVITTLGMISGLSAAEFSKIVVITGIIVLAFADGLSDAVGIHLSEESETTLQGEKVHNQKEIWLTTLFVFISKVIFALTFIIPFLIFMPRMALLISIVWGIFLLTILSFYIAKTNQEKPFKIIIEHITLVFAVIIVTWLIGHFVSILLNK